MWLIRCKTRDEGCKWTLCACRCKTHNFFEITQYTNSHTCVYPKFSQNHSQLGSTLIAKEIQNIVRNDLSTPVPTLHQIIKDKYGYKVHYRKVWEAKRKITMVVFGDYNASYYLLPKWMNVLQATNPGTKVV